MRCTIIFWEHVTVSSQSSALSLWMTLRVSSSLCCDSTQSLLTRHLNVHDLQIRETTRTGRRQSSWLVSEMSVAWAVYSSSFWRRNVMSDWNENWEHEIRVSDAEVVCTDYIRSLWRKSSVKRCHDSVHPYNSKTIVENVKCVLKPIAERTRVMWTGHNQWSLGAMGHVRGPSAWSLTDSIFQLSCAYVVPIKEVVTSNESVLSSVWLWRVVEFFS